MGLGESSQRSAKCLHDGDGQNEHFTLGPIVWEKTCIVFLAARCSNALLWFGPNWFEFTSRVRCHLVSVCQLVNSVYSFFLPAALLRYFLLNRVLVEMLLLLLLLLVLLLHLPPVLLLDLIPAGEAACRKRGVWVLHCFSPCHVVVTWAWQDGSPCRTVKNLLNLEDDSCPMGIKICKAVDKIYEHLKNPESCQSSDRRVFQNRMAGYHRLHNPLSPAMWRSWNQVSRMYEVDTSAILCQTLDNSPQHFHAFSIQKSRLWQLGR